MSHSATDVHSRSRLSGYDPLTLFNARATIVGTGALGQNLALNLALAGTGMLTLCDFDHWEPHNATRSPLFGTANLREQYGNAKAPTVAAQLLPMMTAPSPIVRCAVAPIQAVGDLPFADASIVFSAVDRPDVRGWIQDRCSIWRVPLVEGGFEGPRINLSVFDPGAEAVCYRCNHPETAVGAFSCQRYALQAEEEGIIPAIQNGAGTLGALMAEQGIQQLHGDAPLIGRQATLDIRGLSLKVESLLRDPLCRGVSHEFFDLPQSLPIGADQPLRELTCAVRDLVGPADLRLPDQVLLQIACTRCSNLAEPRAPEWRWLMAPRCSDCGGPFPVCTTLKGPDPLSDLSTEAIGEGADISCDQAGIPPGTAFKVFPRNGGPLLLALAGAAEDVLTRV